VTIVDAVGRCVRLVGGKQATFWIFLVFLGLIIFYMQRARAGKLPSIRRIAGLDAIEEAVGRATELGKSVFYVPGRGGIDFAGAAQTLAGLEILGHVARLTARYDTRLKVAVQAATVYPIAEAIVHQAYAEEGRPEKVRPEMVQFLSDNQFASAAACLSIMNQDRSASVILIGYFEAESLMMAEGAAQIGAVTISGTSRTAQIPFFIAASDYTLIGEEMFAGGAYLSKDPLKAASLAAQDIGKIFAFVSILVGSLLVAFGNKSIITLLRK
jgi:hypothetical protein